MNRPADKATALGRYSIRQIAKAQKAETSALPVVLGGPRQQDLESPLDPLELPLPTSVLTRKAEPVASLPPIAAEPMPHFSNVGSYRVGRELGAGGMATVFEAYREGIDGFSKRVALKRIHAHLAREPRLIELLIDEARLASRIAHPNVCQVLDLGRDERGHFIAMEFLDGVTLLDVFGLLQTNQTLLSHGRHQLLVARLIAGIAEGLHAAHELSDEDGNSLDVVHRDVTPHNLFLLRDGSCKVTDFGVARAKNQLHHTVTGALKGKLAYAAPEQLNRDDIDRRADIFSLGVVTWELLTGVRLFLRASEAATVMAVCSQPAADPVSFQSNIAPELSEIVMRALAIEPEERYQTARAMSRALEHFLARKGDTVPNVDLSDWLSQLTESTGQLPAFDLSEVTHSATRGGGPPVASRPRFDLPAPPAPLVDLGSAAGVLPRPPSFARWLLPGVITLTGAAFAFIFALRGEHQPPKVGGPGAKVAVTPPAPAHGPAAVTETAPPALAPAPAATPPPAEPSATAAKTTPRVTPEPALASPAAKQPERELGTVKPQPTPSPQKPLAVLAPAAAAAPTPAVATGADSGASARTGSIFIATTGGSAEIIAGGRSWGKTPRTVTLAEGVQHITLRPDDGGALRQIEVKIKRGGMSFVTVPVGSTPAVTSPR